MPKKEEFAHITGTISKSTEKALEKFCQIKHKDRVISIPKSHVIDDALRAYLNLPPIKRN